MPQPIFPPEKEAPQILQENQWAAGQVWAGVENLAPTGVRSPDRPARSELLYQISFTNK